MTVLKYIFSYFKDFDRNFQNNYYFVLFPSIQFLTNSRQHRLTLDCVSRRQPIHNTTSNLLSQAFFKTFLNFFKFFFESFFGTEAFLKVIFGTRLDRNRFESLATLSLAVLRFSRSDTDYILNRFNSQAIFTKILQNF